MTPELEREIARAMETEPETLPLLPELLADLWEIGGSVEAVVSLVRSLDLAPGSKVLDLGCGKGAVAVALAKELAFQVEGVDAFPPFLEAARALAAREGVAARCAFREGDVRQLPPGEGDRDLALLLSLGPVLGDHEKTVARLRRWVRPAGYLVIDDGFLAEGVTDLEGYAGYAPRSETLRRLTALGDTLVREVVWSAAETQAVNRRNTELIRRRAERLKAARPELAGPLARYVESQVRETTVLGTELVCAMWLLRRA